MIIQGSNVTITHQIVINGQVAFEANDTVNVEAVSPSPQSPAHSIRSSLRGSTRGTPSRMLMFEKYTQYP